MTGSQIQQPAPNTDIVSFVQSIDKIELFTTVVIVFGLYVFLKIFNRVLSAVYKERHHRAIPQIYITLINLMATLSVGVFISVKVLDQPLNSIITAFSVISVGLAFALQGPILDLFSGFTMDFENRTRQGDWVKLSSGTVGKVVSHNWRSLTLQTNENTIIVVPNSKLMQDAYEIITKNDYFWDEIKVSIDYDLSMRRTARILKEAIMTVPGVYNKQVNVFALEANAGGVDYVCRFQRTDYTERKKICHEILMTIEEALQIYNLGFSESLGEYTISFRKEMQPQWDKREIDYDLLPIVKKTPILGALDEKVLQSILDRSSIRTFLEGDTIVKEGDEGDTMYIILEGSVDVLKMSNDQNVHLVYLHKFNYFGEMALFLNKPRQATIKAETSCVVLEVSRSVIMNVIQHNMDIVDQITTVALNHILDNKQIVDEYEKNNKGKPLLEIIEDTIKALFIR